jgi:hypothetical protein
MERDIIYLMLHHHKQTRDWLRHIPVSCRFAVAERTKFAFLQICRTKGFSSNLPTPENKKAPDGAFVFLAEREGFEPSKGYSPLLVFKTSAFNRSATSPEDARAYLIVYITKRANDY